jgi:hypothetical protein
MNAEKTFQEMLAAAAKAAKGQWNSMREHTTAELKVISTAAMKLEANFLIDMAEARLQTGAKIRAKMEKIARTRAELAHKSLQRAASAVVRMAEADARLAAQDALNAAMKVLTSAVNASLGVPLL